MNTDITFQAATSSDVEAIGSLVRAAYAKWVPVIGREPKPMKADYRLSVERNDFALLHYQGELAGLIETIEKEDCIWIENIAVAPVHQGKGLGQLLLAHVEDRAFSAGHGEVRLLTNADFKSNVELYQKVGYTITHTEPFMGGTTVYMAKRLCRPASSDVKIRLKELAGNYAVARLHNDAAIPGWADGAGFVSISRTDEELSIICLQERIPSGVKFEGDWTVFKFIGPFAFDQTGIVLSIVQPLSTSGIGIFVVSTFDGDHLLLKTLDVERARMILRRAGHSFV
jgi:uncharacterized protein